MYLPRDCPIHSEAMAPGQQKPSTGKALLEKAPTSPSAPEANGEAGAGLSWLTALGFAFLTFNSATAIYRSNGDRAGIFFVGFSYLLLVLLFYYLRWYERTPPGSPRRQEDTKEDDVKMATCLLTTMIVYAVFMLLVFWFADTAPSGAESGTAPPLQNQ